MHGRQEYPLEGSLGLRASFCTSSVLMNYTIPMQVSVWWDGLQVQVKNALHRLQPEPCNDKSWDNVSSVVTV